MSRWALARAPEKHAPSSFSIAANIAISPPLVSRYRGLSVRHAKRARAFGEDIASCTADPS